MNEYIIYEHIDSNTCSRVKQWIVTAESRIMAMEQVLEEKGIFIEEQKYEKRLDKNLQETQGVGMV